MWGACGWTFLGDTKVGAMVTIAPPEEEGGREGGRERRGGILGRGVDCGRRGPLLCLSFVSFLVTSLFGEL